MPYSHQRTCYLDRKRWKNTEVSLIDQIDLVDFYTVFQSHTIELTHTHTQLVSVSTVSALINLEKKKGLVHLFSFRNFL